jgi:hypothetical protein
LSPGAAVAVLASKTPMMMMVLEGAIANSAK